MDPSIIEYLTDRQCSRQWKGFLGAMADEFGSQLDTNALRELMQRLGARFAAQFELAPCSTLDELQFAMSKVWVSLDWGWAMLDEQPDHIRIIHNCAPLRAAFGQDALAWTPAFLEGVYQRWFLQQGAADALAVSQSSAPDDSGCIEYRLAR